MKTWQTSCTSSQQNISLWWVTTSLILSGLLNTKYLYLKLWFLTTLGSCPSKHLLDTIVGDSNVHNTWWHTQPPIRLYTWCVIFCLTTSCLFLKMFLLINSVTSSPHLYFVLLLAILIHIFFGTLLLLTLSHLFLLHHAVVLHSTCLLFIHNYLYFSYM